MKVYIMDLPAPTVVTRQCKCCEGRLGAQNPGDTCGTCKLIQREQRERHHGR